MNGTLPAVYAKQDKFWVQGTPDGGSWEFYTVLADSQTFVQPGGARAVRGGSYPVG